MNPHRMNADPKNCLLLTAEHKLTYFTYSDSNLSTSVCQVKGFNVELSNKDGAIMELSFTLQRYPVANEVPVPKIKNNFSNMPKGRKYFSAYRFQIKSIIASPL
jgi:hypothetical protein